MGCASQLLQRRLSIGRDGKLPPALAAGPAFGYTMAMTQAGDPIEPSQPHSAATLLVSGDYVLREELGTGSMGTVFRAELRRAAHGLPAGAEVAIKFLRRELANDAGAANRLRAEGELGMRVDSPFIAKMHGVIHEQVLGLSVVGLVMELVRGPTLRRFLHERGPAVADLVRRIGEDAARGLQALHDDGLVHRDVKPENMALTPEGRVKLMDLGLAWATDARPGTGGFFGSIAYAAPEILRNRPAGKASDLYSLGVVLYELLTGQHPFADVLNDPDGLLAAHLERDPARPSHVSARVSPFLEAVVLDLLRKEPLVRRFDAATLASTLADGEQSIFWQERLQQAPVQAAERRLRAVRRFAPTGFFGRRAELAQLHRRLASVITSGHGSAVCVTGPEGIGRRRLLDEWIEQALAKHGARIEFVVGAGDHDPALARGAPFPSMLADLLLDGDHVDSPNASERAAARLRTLASDLKDAEIEALAAPLAGHATPLLPQAQADLLVRALLAWKRAHRPPRTLIVRVDRADRLDTTARAVVGALLAAAPHSRLLVVLVMHLRHAQEPFAFHQLPIKGLDRAAFLQLGQALFEPNNAPADAQLEAGCAALGGSPGALIEAFDDLVQQGVLHGRQGALRGLPADVEIRPAPPLLLRVRQRVKELAPEQRHVLQAAAVLGARFPLAELIALVGQPELQVLTALSVFQGRVIRADGDEVAFRHRDFRMALLDLVPRGARRAMHRDAAWVLEQRGAPPLEVGMHMSRAMQHEEALPRLLEGLEGLVAAGSRRAAGRVLARLRVHLAALPDDVVSAPARMRMHGLAARVSLHAGDLDDAGDQAQQLLTRAQAGDDHGARADALLTLARVAARREQTMAALSMLDAAETAAGLLGESGTARRAEVNVKRAAIQLEHGDSEAALQALRQARQALGDAARDHVALHVVEAHTELLRTRLASARKTAGYAIDLAHAAGDAEGELHARAASVAALAAAGDGELAKRQHRRVVELLHRVTAPRAATRATLALGELLAWLDDVAGARPHLLDALASAHADHDIVARDIAALWLRLLGIPVPRLPREETPSTHPVVRALRCLADVKDARGRRDEARALQWIDNAADIERALDLPLHVRLLVLRAARFEGRANDLAAEVAQRLPVTQRRRFQRLVASAARLGPQPLD